MKPHCTIYMHNKAEKNNKVGINNNGRKGMRCKCLHVHFNLVLKAITNFAF